MAKDFMKPPGGPQVTTQNRPQPSKPMIIKQRDMKRPDPWSRKPRRPATPPRAVTEQPVPMDFRRTPSAPLDIDNKVYRPPPQVAPQAPYNRPVPTAPMVDPYIPAQPENRRMRPPGPPMDFPPDRRMRPPGPPMDLPPRAHPMTTTPFAQRPFNPFAPVTPSRPVFPTNPITPNYPDIREREAQRMREFENIAKPIQDPRFMSHRGSLQHLLNRGLSGRVGQQ